MFDAEHGNGTDRVCPNNVIAYPIHLRNVKFQFNRLKMINNEKVIWLKPKIQIDSNVLPPTRTITCDRKI